MCGRSASRSERPAPDSVRRKLRPRAARRFRPTPQPRSSGFVGVTAAVCSSARAPWAPPSRLGGRVAQGYSALIDGGLLQPARSNGSVGAKHQSEDPGASIGRLLVHCRVRGRERLQRGARRRLILAGRLREEPRVVGVGFRPAHVGIDAARTKPAGSDTSTMPARSAVRGCREPGTRPAGPQDRRSRRMASAVCRPAVSRWASSSRGCVSTGRSRVVGSDWS